MSDSSIDVDPGTGAGKLPIGFDLVSAVYIQKTKLVVGPLGTSQYPQLGSQVSSASLAVVIASDQAAIPISGGSSGTQYDEDTPHVSGDKLTMAGVVQQTADAALAGDGDRTALQVDSTGYLKVNVKAGSGSGGTQYAEDSAHVSGDLLFLAGVVQQTADAALSGDGDRSLLQVDATGYLKVNVKAGSSAGPSIVDNAAFTDGTTTIVPVGFIFDEVAGTALTENDAAAARIDSKRAQVLVIEDLTTRGQRLTITAANAAKVDGSAVTQPVSLAANQSVNVAQINGVTPLMGAGVTGTGSHRVTIATDGQGQLVDNAAFTDGTTRLDMAGYIFDEVAGTALTENDAAAARINTNRAQVAAIEDGATRARYMTVTAANAAKVDGSAVTQPVSIAGTVTVDTELTAVAALADATANPTITNIASFLLGFNGATWDRVRVANTGRLQVDVITGGGGSKTDDAAFTIGTDSVSPAGYLADETSTDSVDEGDVGLARMTLDRQVLFIPGERETTGTLNALNAAITVDAKGMSAVSFHVLSSTLVGTITPEISGDNVNWLPVSYYTQGGTKTATFNSFPAMGQIITSGMRFVRLRVSAFTSGTTTGVIHASVATANVRLLDNNTIVGDVRITDGSNTAVVKAASTAPVAADAAVAVALSPNMSTLAGALAKAEDAGHTSADVGVMSLAVRKDDPSTTALTSADVDYSPISVDRYGVAWVRPRQHVTYTAVYRLADATAGTTALAFTFVANTNKQLATIHHAVGSAKEVLIRKVSLFIGVQAAGIFEFEIRPLSATTAPATGNPAITPGKHDQADGAADSTCLALPTTAGSLVAADSPVGNSVILNLGANTAPTNSLGADGLEVVLFDSDARDGVKPLRIRAATAEGYAINGRCVQAVALTFKICIQFTEHTP